MLDETHFHAIADATLNHLHDQLEEAFDKGALDELELFDGVLEIKSASGKTWIVNKHEASRQIWLASPTSGGLHFSFDHDTQQWLLPDERNLKLVLADELQTALKLHIVF